MRKTPIHLLLGAFALSILAIGVTAAPALALSPAVATSPASSLAETAATLNGKVNPNGSETKFYFEYGTTISYGSKTAEVSAGSGTTTLEKSQPISGLAKNTVYHYRIVASNAFGKSQGVDQTFTTVGAPTVETKEAVRDISGSSATLNATVDPNGQATTYQFEYGTVSGAYTNTVPISAESAGSGYAPIAVSQKITGLTAGTKYYFRVTASNASGKVNGAEKAFFASTSALTSPAGTVLKTGASFSAELEEDLQLVNLGTSSLSLKCKQSKFEGKLIENQLTATVKGSLFMWSPSECGGVNTVTAINNPSSSIEFYPTGSGNGTVKASGLEITSLTHVPFYGTVHCLFYTENTTIGSFSGSKGSGSTGTLNLNGKFIPLRETDTVCGSVAELKGSYKFTAPDYLDID